VYKISKVSGEDVKKISDILLAISKRIGFSRGQTFPDTYVDTIINLLQTSSVPPFNDQFHDVFQTRTKELAQEQVELLSGRAPSAKTILNDLTTIKMLLGMATTFFETYSQEGGLGHTCPLQGQPFHFLPSHG
jgi:hypothetical protein